MMQCGSILFRSEVSAEIEGNHRNRSFAPAAYRGEYKHIELLFHRKVEESEMVIRNVKQFLYFTVQASRKDKLPAKRFRHDLQGLIEPEVGAGGLGTFYHGTGQGFPVQITGEDQMDRMHLCLRKPVLNTAACAYVDTGCFHVRAVERMGPVLPIPQNIQLGGTLLVS